MPQLELFSVIAMQTIFTDKVLVGLQYGAGRTRKTSVQLFAQSPTEECIASAGGAT